MADPVTMAAVMGGMGAAKYAGDVSANENANKLNAAANKWAPLLAVYGSHGMSPVARHPANLGADLFPAALLGAMALGGGAAAPAATGAPAANPALFGPGYAAGGKVGKVMGEFKSGELHSGSPKGPVVHNPKQAIAIALSEAGKSKKAAGGMMVPGKAPMPGDSTANDTVPVMASPGEGIVPRSVMKNPNKWKVAAYLNEVKKHGPGPLPVKKSGDAPKSKSINPWAAMMQR